MTLINQPNVPRARALLSLRRRKEALQKTIEKRLRRAISRLRKHRGLQAALCVYPDSAMLPPWMVGVRATLKTCRKMLDMWLIMRRSQGFYAGDCVGRYAARQAQNNRPMRDRKRRAIGASVKPRKFIPLTIIAQLDAMEAVLNAPLLHPRPHDLAVIPPKLGRLRIGKWAASHYTHSMSLIPHTRLIQVIERFDEVEARMGVATVTAEIIALSKEHSDLKPVADKARELVETQEAMDEAQEMLVSGDPDMLALAREEIELLKGTLPALEADMQILLLPKDADDAANVVLEVRAGTGGDEASLFAGNLFAMYSRYASLQGWSVEVVSQSAGDAGGYKEIIANVAGDGVFGRWKFESGVHRVQRVPDTESAGRVHTSAATVAVLPAPENVEIEVRQEDIRIDTMRASGSGGQHVNTTDSAVRITHLPTGIVATSSEKSQHVNRDKAMQMLKIRLYERERAAVDSARAEARKSQVGSGDRSERIRTYNYPQGRVTDHRINLTLYALDKIVSGEGLDDVVSALLNEDRALKLAAMQQGLE